MKPVMRTTVILDEELRKKLKLLSIQKDISMKEIMTQALEEKIKRELDGGSSGEINTENSVVTSISEVLSPYVGNAASRLVIAQSAKIIGTVPRKLTRMDFNKEMVDLICNKLSAITDADNVREIRTKLTALMKKR